MIDTVTLDRSEILLGAYIGLCRNIRNLHRIDTARYSGSGWDIHIDGALGEMAAAKALGFYWHALDSLGTPDVGSFEVRTAPVSTGGLILRPADKSGAVFVLVVRLPTGDPATRSYRLAGWLRGADGKQTHWLTSPDASRPPCYLIPQSALNPLESLPPP